MRAVVQRVSQRRVEVQGRVVGSVGPGLAVLAAVETGDTAEERAWMAGKIANLRIFEAGGKMDRSVLDLANENESDNIGVLLISNFTVAGSVKKGRRPSFDGAMRPPEAQHEFDALVEAVRGHGLRVETGVFGAMMDVHLVNDGPVTIVIDSAAR